MVHHVQNLSGRTYDCPAAREAEAYGLQDRWLAMFGTALKAEFEMNEIKSLVLTRCRLR